MTDSTGYEKKDVNVKAIVITGIFIALFIIVSLIMLNEYFTAEKESLVEEVVLEPDTTISLMELRAVEDTALTSYELLDSTKKVYRIPILRAMEIIAEEKRLK